MSKNIFLGLVVGVVALFAISGTAMAGTSQGTLTVNANVAATGRIISVDTLDFGTYDPTDTNPLDGQADINYRVAKGVDYWIYISETGVDTRQMNGPVDTLDFDLYTDVARTNRWENTKAEVPTVNSPDNSTQTATVYGQIPALQNVGLGAYTVDLTVTLEF